MAGRVKVLKDDVAKYFRAAYKADGGRVKVGIQTGDGSVDRDGITMAELAMVHEFGSRDGHIPQRSFLRSTVDENERRYVAAMKKELAKIPSGKATVRGALRQTGERMRSDVIDKIRRGIPPPNAPSTIARKGSSTPLIDTGQLLQSITVKVDTDG